MLAALSGCTFSKMLTTTCKHAYNDNANVWCLACSPSLFNILLSGIKYKIQLRTMHLFMSTVQEKSKFWPNDSAGWMLWTILWCHMWKLMNQVMNHPALGTKVAERKVGCLYWLTGWFAAKKCHWRVHRHGQLDHDRFFIQLYSLTNITQSPAFGFRFVSFVYIMFLFSPLQFKKNHFVAETHES